MAMHLQEQEVVQSDAVVKEQPASGARQLPHMLVVDDENGPRQALRMLLKEEFTVHLASNVPEGLAILEHEAIELIITDIRMPKQTGVDLLRQVKATKPDIQVIIVTGYGHLDTAVKAVEFGAFAYIEKPFDNDAMLQTVYAAQDRFRAERERHALEQMALEASRFETLGRLVSGMMHDMGSPLTVLSSQIELLLINPHRDDICTRLTTMKAQVQHCSDMARSTMDYLRTDEYDDISWRLNSVVVSSLDIAASMLKERNVTLERDFGASLPASVGEMVLVRQAILNLITNACQAMEGNRKSAKIRVRTWAEDGNACLSIEDNGPGIPESRHRAIFDTFYSTKGKNGTGLGLSVVRSVMQRCGGTVALDPTYTNGARFVLRFPSED